MRPFMAFFSTVSRSSPDRVARSRIGTRCLRWIIVTPPTSGQPSMRRRSLIIATGTLAAPRAFAQRGPDTFEIAASETATIDGRQWDTPLPGGTTMDAVHRSVLLRFPTAADEIAERLRTGRVIEQAELVMAFDGIEIVPQGYTCRDGLGRKLWTDNPPNWHVRAWPLRQAWQADKKSGPTFNASANGTRYWARYGASDPRDRGAEIGEPQEL